MRPTLWKIPLPFTEEMLDIPAYGFMIMIAFIAGTYLAAWRAKRWGINPDNVIDAGLYAVIFGILGARLLFTIQYFDVYFWGTVMRDGKPYNQIHNIYKIWQGGLVFYGGLIGAATAIILMIRKRKLKISLMSDLCLPSVMLGLAITRIGCFLNGCCFGRVCSLPWSVSFKPGSHVHSQQLKDIMVFIQRQSHLIDPAFYNTHMDRLLAAIKSSPDGILQPEALSMLSLLKDRVIAAGAPVEEASSHIQLLLNTPFGEMMQTPLPVHPSQIYASIMGFVIFGLLLFMHRYRKFDGFIGTIFIMTYAINRFILETFRSDNAENWGLTISQWISVGLFCGGLALFMYLKNKGDLTELPIIADPQTADEKAQKAA